MRGLNRFFAFAALLSPAVLSLSISGSGHAEAQARTFKVDESGGSSIQFVSDAPLEKFTGKSTSVSGELKVDPAKAQQTKGELKVDAASIKTNLALRDEHLRGENWLDAKKHPAAKLVITKVTGAEKLKPNDLTEVTVTGKFTLHGVTKDITAKAKVRYTPVDGGKDTVRVQSSFTVHLEDYKISIPSIVALKVSPDIVVNVDLRANAS
jgi:polyisoprenoid-binding protein YceI